MVEALKWLPHYPDPQYYALRSALAAHHRVDRDAVLPGNGVAELLTWVGRDCGLLDAPAIGLLTPAFGDYQRALRGFGVGVVPYPLFTSSGSALDLQASPLLGLDPGVSGLIINNPHNPTGHLFTQTELLPLLDRFSLVVVDEAFMDFLPPGQDQSLVPWLKDYPNLVVLRSLTKFYTLPGLRIGYALAHPDRLRRWQSWRDPWPVNQLAVAAAMAAITDQGFQARTWQWLPPTRQALAVGLRAIPGLSPWPGAANYLLVQADQAVPPLQERLLREHQILIRDCLSFRELGDRYLRVAVRTTSENERLLTALTQIKAV